VTWWEAARARLDDPLYGDQSAIEESMVVGAQEDDVLECVLAPVLAGDDVRDIAGSFAPPANGTFVHEFPPDCHPERVGVCVRFDTPCSPQRESVGHPLACSRAEARIRPVGAREEGKGFTAYFARLRLPATLIVSWVDALERESTGHGAELRALEVPNPGSPGDRPTALTAVISHVVRIGEDESND
jgi:hypothetical protein